MAEDTGIAKLTGEVADIKRLLVYALLGNGMSQEAVASALGKDQSYVSRMFGKGGVTKRPRSRKSKGAAATGAPDA